MDMQEFTRVRSVHNGGRGRWDGLRMRLGAMTATFGRDRRPAMHVPVPGPARRPCAHREGRCCRPSSRAQLETCTDERRVHVAFGHAGGLFPDIAFKGRPRRCLPIPHWGFMFKGRFVDPRISPTAREVVVTRGKGLLLTPVTR